MLVHLDLGSINRRSKLPLHQQLYELLRENIQRGDWKVGEMIPSETDLISHYKLSRSTIRQVLDRLTNDGLIYRLQGRGTFVAETTLEQGLTRIISFTEDMRRRGLASGTKVMYSGLVGAPDLVAAALQIQASEPVARLDRLRLANNEPMCIEESFLVHRLCPGVLEHDFNILQLTEILGQNYNIRINRALQTIRAVAATEEQAAVLSVAPQAPILFIQRVSFSDRDIPVEFLKLYFRGDRYSLYNELQR